MILFAETHQDEDGIFIATCEELPVDASGDTKEEAKDRLREAVADYFEALDKVEPGLADTLRFTLDPAIYREIVKSCEDLRAGQWYTHAETFAKLPIRWIARTIGFFRRKRELRRWRKREQLNCQELPSERPTDG